jgi:hypothetical protein
MRERGCMDEIISAGSKAFGALAALDGLALFPLRYDGRRERVKGIEPSFPFLAFDDLLGTIENGRS